MDATFHSSLNTSRMFVPETPGVEDKRLSRLIRKGKEYTQNPIAIVLLKHPRKGQRVYTKPYCYSTPSTPSDRAKSTQNPIAIVFLAHPRTGQRVHKPLLLLYSQDTLGKGKEYTKPYCYYTTSTPSDRAKSTHNPIAIVLLGHPRKGQRVHKTLLLLYSQDTLGKGKEYTKPYCYSTPSTPSERAKSTQNPIAIVLLAHPRTGQRVHKTLLLLYSQHTLGQGKEYTKPYCYCTPRTPSEREKSTQNPIAIVLLAHPRRIWQVTALNIFVSSFYFYCRMTV